MNGLLSSGANTTGKENPPIMLTEVIIKLTIKK